MQKPLANKPLRVNRDSDEKYLPAEDAFYMLNSERSVNSDGTLGKLTPMASNEMICEVDDYYDGYWVGQFKSILTNEIYFFRFVPNGVNYILRVNEDSTCEVVYEGDCLPLSALPEHAITDSIRVYLKYDKICAHRHGKQLIWVDGSDNPIGMLDVEASIATNNFTTPFFDICPDPCAHLQMCVPEPCGAIEAEFIPLEPADEDLNNALVDVGIQIRFKHVYYDERASEWSDISSLYFQDSKGCFDDAEGLPRCMKFRVPVGNPMVDKIEIAYSVNNGQQWFLTDTVEKYEPYQTETQYWYERNLADLPGFSSVTCDFEYTFCNDKECKPINPAETGRVFNPMPREPQALIRIKDSLGFLNYIKGNCPLPEAETKKIELSLDCDPANNCQEEFVDITVNAIIHNFDLQRPQYIYRAGGKDRVSNSPDDENDPAYFGGIRYPVGYDSGFTPAGGYGQFFNGRVRNFIVYIEGMPVFAQMKQYRATYGLTSSYEYGVVSSVGSSLQLNFGTEFFYQKATIRVKKGTKGFLRLASHQSITGIGNEQDTSTQVSGTIANLNSYPSVIASTSGVKEIYFDTCDVTTGKLDITETFVINDHNTPAGGSSHSSSAYTGYLTDNGNKPIEGGEIFYNNVRRSITDHNGFYFFDVYGNENDQNINTSVRVELNCGAFAQAKTQQMNGSFGNMVRTDIQITNADDPDYETANLQIVTIPVVDCNNVPVGGIRVAITGSKYAVSDGTTGIATFRLRNYSARNRLVRGVLMNDDYCISLDCSGNCNPCMPKTLLNLLPACFIGGTTVIALETPINRLSIFSSGDNKKGLKAGGRYQWGVQAKGDCGRVSAVYEVTILDGSLVAMGNFMDVPKTQSKGGISFCQINYDFNGALFPDWVKCLKLVRTKNVLPYVLQWVVDKIERTADGKIKLTIQSLNDYNARYNFESNTSYEYLRGDRVEFISNGDGTIYDIATWGLKNYQILSPFHDEIISGEKNAPANFFNQILIDDDGTLDELTEGAKIEIQRPKDCVEENIEYFEVASFDAVNITGGATAGSQTGTFSTFDTYFVNRQIGDFAPQIFEHRNPSDFWGDALNGISDVGKVYFKNKYENEKRYGRNITINTQNQFNRFGSFEKTLDAPEQGDIIAAGIYDGKIGLGIGQFDNFLFQISDDFLKVGSDGIVRAAPVDSLISDTEPKVSGIFGCQYEDIGSVFFGDGFITWIDANKSALVKHDFNIAKDVSLGKYQSWFRRKIQRKIVLNSLSSNDEEKFRWITGFNYFTNSLQVTIKALTSPNIYNEKDALLQDYETILFDPRTEDFLTNAGYVQDAYSTIKLIDSSGCAFVSAAGNKIYKHPIIPTTYNEFNDTATDWVIGVIMNQLPNKIKIPVSLELQSEQMWYVTKVVTDDPNFLSEIPPIRFKKTERKWNASFLYNINSIGGLYGITTQTVGEQARGYYIKVTFIRDNTVNLAVNTTNSTKMKAYGEIDMILSKVYFSEQSGFTENL